MIPGQKRVLILGGTRDAIELATQAAAIPGVVVVTSLAGRTREPVIQSENTRIGGFGGISGLADYLHQQRIDLLIDATHPFAAQISFNAAAATRHVGIPRLMLVRPPWQPVPGDRWLEVESNAAAAAMVPELARRIFLTIGRQELAAFAHLQQLWFLMRMIDPPHPDARIPHGKLLLERGPFLLENERSLLQAHKIEAIVSKNSGGTATYAKIIAARELGLPVVMVQRPAIPDGETVSDVRASLTWLKTQLNL